MMGAVTADEPEEWDSARFGEEGMVERTIVGREASSVRRT